MSAKIVITGISGSLGRKLARRLHHQEESIVGIDKRLFFGRPKDIEVLQADLRRKMCEELFRKNRVKAVFHVGILHNPRLAAEEHQSFNIMGTQTILQYVVRYRVPKLVVLSSAAVYGSRPDNVQFLTEESPMLAGGRHHELRDLVAVDMLAGSFFWKHPKIETVILRPVHILGELSNTASNYLRLERVPTLMGFDPMIQVIHEEDVVDAMVLALKPKVRGIYNIVGPGAIPLSKVLRALGKPSVPLPHPMASRIVEWLWKWKITSFSPANLHHLRYICMVDGSRAERELGFRAKRSLEEALWAAASPSIYAER